MIAFTTTNNYLVIVDEADYEKIKDTAWLFNQGYVKTSRPPHKNLNVVITGNKINRHLNRNPLDFRRENIA